MSEELRFSFESSEVRTLPTCSAVVHRETHSRIVLISWFGVVVAWVP